MALTVHSNPARVVISSGLDCMLGEAAEEKGRAALAGPRHAYISFDDPAKEGAAIKPPAGVYDASTQGSGAGSECASESEAPPAPAPVRTALRSKASAFVPCAALWPAPAWPLMLPPPPGLGLELEVPEPTVGQMIEVEGITTLMLRNIPPEYTRIELADLLDSMGLARQYDFVYVPMSLTSKRNVGYGFVNLTSPAAAHRFNELFEGFRGWPCPPEEPSMVSRSQVQGLAANICRYQNSPIMSPEVPDAYRPALFCDGERFPFPEPTKAVKKPKIRKGGRY